MSEDKKESKVEESTKDSTSVQEAPKDDSNNNTQEAKLAAAESAVKAAEDAATAAKAAEDAESAAQKAIAKATAAKLAAESAAEAEYKAIADEVKSDTAKGPDYTFKRQGEEIFRRDMGEPEFFLDKKDRFPRPILSADEQESLTRQAEIPQDQTPAYNPQHVLSPEFGGVSNYEREVNSFLDQTRQKLEKLKNNLEPDTKKIRDAENKITYLESLHENFYIGMNVFRTAKGGRSKLKA